jgi:HEPN domain-containing protein
MKDKSSQNNIFDELYLFSKRQKLIKTHILPRLLKNCLKFNKNFEELKTACEILSLYYTEARYPDDVDTSSFDTKEKAKEAIDLAMEVLNFVEEKIK